MDKISRRQFLLLSGTVAGVAAFEVACSSKPTPLANKTTTSEEAPTATKKPMPSATPINLANRYIAVCGLDCTGCPQYGSSTCERGCLGEACSNYCMACDVRNCARQHQVANCAFCDEYPCQILEAQYKSMEKSGYLMWANAARDALELVHQDNQ